MKQKLRCIIAGGREFSDFDMVCRAMDFYLNDTLHDDVIIIEGGARGADRLGREYAKLRGYPFKTFEADWTKYGNGAGHRRNAEMAAVATHLVLFWDGKSRGSADMKKQAEKHNLIIRVVFYT